MSPANEKEYDVVIVGAGPAGCACALALKDAGLTVALVEKESFPRDKICGDAIPGRAIKVLNSIDTAFAGAFRDFPQKCLTKSTTAFYKGRSLTFDWKLEAYTCPRLQFDHFLFSLVQQHTKTDTFTNAAPGAITYENNGISLKINEHTTLHTRLVIGADGAHSVVARHLTNRAMDRRHFVGSVRAYYTNVSGMQENNIEVYFDKRFLPSYLWVFPVGGNIANVGFGMLSSEIARRKINLRKAFYQFIEQTPALQQKFTNASQCSELEGFGLPLGSKTGILSGDNFMLTGDAASLIDPITGDGIGNAMLSGKLAAEQAIRCFGQQNFTSGCMMAYDAALQNSLGGELKARYSAQRTLSAMPFLLDALFLAGQNRMLKKLIQKRL